MMAIYKIGFTGTSKGMLPEQVQQVRDFLINIQREYDFAMLELHYGYCIGADEQAAEIAKELGYRVVAHPGFNPRSPEGRMFRSEFTGNDEVREEKPFVKRDRDIVDETDLLVAAPLTREEQRRSGTWTTVRYAKKVGRRILFAYPAMGTTA